MEQAARALSLHSLGELIQANNKMLLDTSLSISKYKLK